MARRAYDSRLLHLFSALLQKLAGWEPGPEAAELKPIIVDKATRGKKQLEKAVNVASDETREAEEADDTLSVLAGSSDELFKRIYHALVARFHALQAAGKSSHDSHTTALDRFLEGFSPSSYRDASAHAKVEVLGEAVRLSDHFLDAEWQSLADEAAQMHAELSEASSTASKETGEADAAAHERNETHEQARQFYLATRDLLSGALRVDGNHELLRKWAPPISSIRGTRGGSTTDTSPADEKPQTDEEPQAS